MGIADGVDLSVVPDDLGDQFKRIAKLAMISKASSDGPGSVAGGSQIGRRASQGGALPAEDEIETLRKSMAKARKKMEEDTPDTSPTSSRGCSPYPGLYSGPNLLSTIQGLDLSPDASRMNTPLPMSAAGTMRKEAVDKQATDPGMLTIPGRRAESTLRTKGSPESIVDTKQISVTPPAKVEGADDRMKSFINDAAKSMEPKQADRPRELNVSKLIEIDSPQPKSRSVVIDVNSARNAPETGKQGSRIDDARSKFGSDAPAQPNYGRPRPAPSAGRPPAQFDLKPAPGRPAPGRAEPERENVPMKSVGGGKEFERRNSAGKIPDAEDGADIENVEFVRRKPKGKRQTYD